MMRVACLGINANPPHLGHLEAATVFLDSGFVDRVWFIPTFEHHFDKPDIASWEHRVNMCRLLENQEKGIWVSLAECEMTDLNDAKPDKSYTVYTLRYLRATYPNFKFVWCVGSDTVTTGSYKDWHNWDELAREEKILVCERAGYPLPGVLPKPFTRAGRCLKDISSSRIRALLRVGMTAHEYTGEKIAEYIRKHKLYTKGG